MYELTWCGVGGDGAVLAVLVLVVLVIVGLVVVGLAVVFGGNGNNGGGVGGGGVGGGGCGWGVGEPRLAAEVCGADGYCGGWGGDEQGDAE